MTFLKCPKCGGRMIEVNLASNPMQYEAECSTGDVWFSRIHRTDPHKKVTQEELDEFWRTNERTNHESTIQSTDIQDTNALHHMDEESGFPAHCNGETK